MSKLVVVIGITGVQGGSVTDSFLADTNWRVRGITRDPSKPAAQEWAARGVELVAADLDDVESLKRAFTGAQAIFAMTDYWAPILDPSVRAAAAARGIGASQICAELETQRGKNMAIAAAAPGVQRTLERFIYSGLASFTKLSGGKYTKAWHFDSKAAVEEFVHDDPEMVSAGLSGKSSFIHVGIYTDNWRRSPLEIVKDPESDGYYRVQMSDGRDKVPFIWARRDTGPLVKKLVEDVKPGITLLGVSQIASHREYLNIWARTVGKKLAGDEGIKQISAEEYVKKVGGDEDQKEHILETWKSGEEFGYDGDDVLHPKDIGAEHLLTSIEEYMQWEDWSSVLDRD
ncbi:NmrA-like protein [Diaporthe amygdali]|uniref:NmrA-like protein n=1 Tax=Phomopsis amygdali TaxID=1214568 RepID=UPI0022FF0D72|nr:NmrA-like protein [Diaporthe amygdali]KAJ0104342.1 NmrA-like protein [Diaporthe amygdali]